MNFINTLKKKLALSEASAFRISIGLKFAFVPTFSFLFAIILNFFVLRVIVATLLSFDNARNFVIADTLYVFVEKSLVDLVPWFVLLFSLLLILGMFLANIVLRPFRIIGEHCENLTNNKESTYDPEFLTNLKLLSSFSEWFFSTVKTMSDVGVIKSIQIPGKYKKIHKPVFESNFFFSNLLIVIITTISSCLLIFYANFDIHEGVVSVVKEFFYNKNELKLFLMNVEGVFHMINIVVIVFNVFSYGIFFLHLYSKVSTPAFGIFATMRSFISGRFSTRVHLIGYPYVRNYTRMLNKYLDILEREKKSKEN